MNHTLPCATTGRRAPLILLLGALTACGVTPLRTSSLSNTLCQQTANIDVSPDAKRWGAIRAGLREHALFDGHVINHEGQLQHFGLVESETSNSAAPSQAREQIAWLNVKRYWDTLDRQLSGRFIFQDMGGAPPPGPSLSPVVSFAPQTDSLLARKTSVPLDLERALEQTQGLNPAQRLVLTQSLYRAAINDVPWSASFISDLMAQAGYGLNQFEFSAAHSNYMRKAYAVTRQDDDGAGADPALIDYSYRACNARTTAARPGDMLCALRSAPYNQYDFEQIGQLLAGNLGARAYPAHCELVTAVDRPARTLSMVGGNVLQSVALRTLKLSRAGSLERCYFAARDKNATGCGGPFNSRRWEVLLQHREPPTTSAPSYPYK